MSRPLTENIVRSLVDAVDADRDAMRELLTGLVAVPTENPPATGYRPCVELLASALRRLRFDHEVIDIPSPAEAPRAAIRACASRLLGMVTSMCDVPEAKIACAMTARQGRAGVFGR